MILSWRSQKLFRSGKAFFFASYKIMSQIIEIFLLKRLIFIISLVLSKKVLRMSKSCYRICLLYKNLCSCIPTKLMPLDSFWLVIYIFILENNVIKTCHIYFFCWALYWIKYLFQKFQLFMLQFLYSCLSFSLAFLSKLLFTKDQICLID